MDEESPWRLEGFEDALDRWIDQEKPSIDLSIVVTAWIFTRREHPYAGVRREAAFENLWFGAVPGTIHDATSVVACSYWIFESERRIRCDSFPTLSLPL